MHFYDTHHMRNDSVSDEILSCRSTGRGGSTALHVMLASPRNTKEEEEAKGGLQPYSTSKQVILAVTAKNHFPLAEPACVWLIWTKGTFM